MNIGFLKLHADAVLPVFAKPGDTAVDLIATEINRQDDYVEYRTGIAIEIPEGYFGLLRPRSSVSNRDLLFKTSGVIDSGYRGELMVRFSLIVEQNKIADIYKVGDRVCQLIILPYVTPTYIEVKSLSKTDRGEGGFGSTGVK